MKVIDLLNRIANGEEIPLKIEVKGYEYRRSNGQFWCDETESYLIDNCTSIYQLNDEVKIKEEDKKIEKIETYDKVGNIFIDDRFFKYIPIDKHHLTANEQVFVDKINEIIKVLNEMREDK